MELEYSNYIPKLLKFWENNIKNNSYKINILNNSKGKEFMFLLKEAEKGTLLNWLNTKDSYLAYIILFYFISKMNYTKKNFYSNDHKSILFMEMGLENYIDILNLEELITILSPYIHSEDINKLIFARDIINSKVDLIDNKIKILYFRLDSMITILKKFGRYPERNKILNRLSTEAEIDYLDTLES